MGISFGFNKSTAVVFLFMILYSIELRLNGNFIGINSLFMLFGFIS